MTNRNKVGFHGIGTGIGGFLRALTKARIRGVFKSLNNEGWIVEVVEAARASGVDHTIIFRGPAPDHDVPNISLDPTTSAEQHWALVKSHLPAGVVDNRGLVWIEPTNEMSTNATDAPGTAWVADFSLAIARLMNGEGYRALLWAANSGQPEQNTWTNEFRAFLEYCAEHPDVVGISTHEYMIDADYQVDPPYHPSIHPWHIGRFQRAIQAADELGIPRPTIVISELGWAYNDIPNNADKAKADIDWWSKFLAQYPNVKGACLWTLDQGWKGATAKLPHLIPWLTEYTLTTEHPDPEPPPAPRPEPEPTGKRAVTKRRWNMRDRPAIADDSLLFTAEPGDKFVVVRKLEGEPYRGETAWYELKVFAHSAGLAFEEAPEPEPEPEPDTIDLLPYLRGDGRAYELQYTYEKDHKLRL